MLHVPHNMHPQGNILLTRGLFELQNRLPKGWYLGKPSSAPAPLDAVVDLRAPSSQTARIAFVARAQLDPKDVAALVESIRTASPSTAVTVISFYLSEGTRARLRERNLGYFDLTGNTRIVVDEPGLFIETQGASRNPHREERPARSLRGPKAGRIVRALVDRKQPPGVREIATLTELDPGYVSRVLAFLDREALVTRVGRGRIQSVDWPALLRRWATEAPLESRGEVRSYLEPRGLSSLVARLASSDERYAITGSLAANLFVPEAPVRLATIWLRDAGEAATRLGLRSVEAGANVLLVEPYDEVVFRGAMKGQAGCYVAPSQAAADLLTSPGRGPAEGEALIGWMETNEDWRS
jgi:hypothetical protein